MTTPTTAEQNTTKGHDDLLWPQTMDGMAWAIEFNKRFPSVSVDDALGWFCNALMRGVDSQAATIARLEGELKIAAEIIENACSANAQCLQALFAIMDDDSVADQFANQLSPDWFIFAERVEALRDQVYVWETLLEHERTRVDAAERRVEAAATGLRAVEALIIESRGVIGLHLNGDEAPWGDVRTGGRFEEWLREFDTALAAASKEEG